MGRATAKRWVGSHSIYTDMVRRRGVEVEKAARAYAAMRKRLGDEALEALSEEELDAFIAEELTKLPAPPPGPDPLTRTLSYQATLSARAVLAKRYLKKSPDGKPCEEPEEMFARVARNLATAELLHDPEADFEGWSRRFYELMVSRDFVPNSPTLMNAGRELQQLSACFVLPVEDSMESIFETIKDTALIHKSGGGTGFAFSRLRPKNSPVKSTGGVSSGPISFLRVFNAATEAVKQGGTRRGANMGILRVDHPDIEEFISCKRDVREITNFNISVALTEAFMRAVDRGEDYPLIDPHTGREVRRLHAPAIFRKIVEGAWGTGEPGIVFLDRINDERTNPTPALGQIESTNPCGEQPLLPYESCNLGSLNLANMLQPADGGWAIDWEHMGRATADAIRFLDNIIDMNFYPLDKIDLMTKANRRVGLGVMGFADMLFRLRVPYHSDAAVAVAEEVMAFIQGAARRASQRLAEERGPFPNFQLSVFARRGEPPQRNATVTTIAPTGTISIIGGCSSGVEPVFALAFTRNVMDRDLLPEVHPYFEEVARREGFYSPDLMRAVAARGTVQGLAEVPEEWRRVFVCSYDISPEWHARIQAAFQKHTDNAVSKTVNFPANATPEDVERVYRLAYELGRKGVTIYRDSSRPEQVLSVGVKEEVRVGETLVPVLRREKVHPVGGKEGTAGPARAADGGEPGEAPAVDASAPTDGGPVQSPPAGLGSDNGGPGPEGASSTAARPLPGEVEAPRPSEPAPEARGPEQLVARPGSLTPRPRPEVTRGTTQRMETGAGHLYVTINEDDEGNPFEVFVNIGKGGSFAASQNEAVGRLISLALRSGVDLRSIIEQLRGISDGNPIFYKGQVITSCADAIGRALEDYLVRKGEEPVYRRLVDRSRSNPGPAAHPLPVGACPDCGGALYPADGCVVCRTCG
ncbi:MAG: vitamin B12-dependent ribonucleotide reductase, partial [Nitrospinota bacterium]